MRDSINNPQVFKTKWPFYWVSQINAAYARALERRIKPLGLDMPRWRAMMSLHDDTYLSISEIAAFSAQKLNTTTKVIQRMIDDGLVERRTSPTDKRVTEVCLTDAGEKLRSAALQEALKVYDLTFSDMPAKEVEALNIRLSDLCSRLSSL